MCPKALDQFLLTSFVGFGRKKKAKSLWQCAVYAIVWCIWLERNSCIFNGKHSDKQILWDRIRRLASTWCKVHDFFRGVSLSDMQRDLKALLLFFFFFLSIPTFCIEDLLSSLLFVLCFSSC